MIDWEEKQNFVEEKKIFSNFEKELKVAENWLNYPNNINSIWSYETFDLSSPFEIDFDKNYDKMLELPIKSLEISKNWDMLNIILKYYRNYNCDDPDWNEARVSTLLIKKKIN